MKECRTCKKAKEESEFSVNRYKKDGTPIYKPDCKMCMRKPNKTTITDHTNTIKKTITDNKIIPQNNNTNNNITTKSTNKENTITDHTIYTRLNALEREVTNLKAQIISNTIDHNTTITDHNYNFDKKNRIKATYNIEKDIKNTLDQYCKSNLKNNSDIVNIALIEFFDKQK